MKKNIIITGASGGIGSFLVRHYAQNLEYHVIALDRVSPEPSLFEGLDVDYYYLDQSQSAQVRACFGMLAQRYGQLHVLINNAGISNFHKSIFEIQDEDFERVIQTNLCGLFYCSRAFVEANDGQTFGRIVNLASTRWAQNEAGWDAYGASKGGIVALTASMAVSLMDTPITVNCISPGWIATSDYDALSNADHAQHPSGRVGKPEDIEKAISYLMDQRNDFVNGQNLVIDGGMTKRMFYVE